jgi:gamma-glutamyltranspeptidase/glutathione hydrolase
VGLGAGERNAIQPGKRPLSSMTPTIVLDEDRAWLVAGGSGSAHIISGTLEALLGVIDFGLDAQAAVSAPRIHTQWMPQELLVEPFHPKDVIDGLARRGHKIERSAHFCVIQMVTANADGSRSAASDPRKGGEPAGY